MLRQDIDSDLYEMFENVLLGAKGVDVNEVRHNGQTLLFIAAGNGHETYVKALVAAGANVNTARRDGPTPLHIAAQLGHKTCVNALLTAGANVHAADWSDGATPLHLAAQFGHEACVNAIVAADANVNAVTVNGVTPLHLAVYKAHETCVKALLAAGANVNAALKDGRTPLHIAAHNGHETCVKALLGAGANVHAALRNGKSPLHYASLQGHFNILNMLLNELDTWFSSVTTASVMLFGSWSPPGSIVSQIVDGSRKFQEKLRDVNNDDQLVFLSSFTPRYIIPLAYECSRLGNPIVIPAPLVKQAVQCSRLRRSGFSFVAARVVTARDESNRLMNRAAIMIAISIFLDHPTKSPYLNYAKFPLKDVWVSILNYAVDLSLSRAEWETLAFFVAKQQVKAGLNDYSKLMFWNKKHGDRALILQPAIHETKTADDFKKLLGEEFALLSESQHALGGNDKKQPLTKDAYYLLVKRWATRFLDDNGKFHSDQLPAGSAVVETQEDDFMGFHLMRNQQ